MGDKVFRNIIELTSNDGNIVKPLFDTERLEAWAKQLALEYTGDENAKIMPHPKSGFGNINNRGCKV